MILPETTVAGGARGRSEGVAGGRGKRVAGASLTPAAGELASSRGRANPTLDRFEVLQGETPEATPDDRNSLFLLPMKLFLAIHCNSALWSKFFAAFR